MRPRRLVLDPIVGQHLVQSVLPVFRLGVAFVQYLKSELLKDQRDSSEFDRIYRSYFTSQDTLPARTRMQAGRTPMDCGLEVEAIGYVPKAVKAGLAKRGVKKAAKKTVKKKAVAKKQR